MINLSIKEPGGAPSSGSNNYSRLSGARKEKLEDANDLIDSYLSDVSDAEKKKKWASQMKPLEDNEIEQAELDIHDLHPIADTKFEVAFPFIGCFFTLFARVWKVVSRALWAAYSMLICKRWKKIKEKDIQEQLVKQLKLQKKHLHIKQKEVKANDQFMQDRTKDPFLQFGFGLIAYRNLLEALIAGFFLLSCLAYPAMQIYKKGQGYDPADPGISKLDRMTLGNLGYSTVQCLLVTTQFDKLAL